MFRVFLGVLLAHGGASAATKIRPESCENAVAGMDLFREQREQTLRRLHLRAPEILGPEIMSDESLGTLMERIIASLNPSRMVLATLASVGSGRKSTIFAVIESLLSGDMSLNLRPETRKSRSDYGGGTTRQAVVMTGEQDLDSADMVELDRRLNGITRRLWTEGAAEREGEGVLVQSKILPPGFAIADTPGFDVNAKDQSIAERYLLNSEVIIIPSGETITKSEAFIAALQNSIRKFGYRKFVLIYNGYVSQSDAVYKQMVAFMNRINNTPHRTTLPENVLGAYLMPADEAVATYQKHIEIRPIQYEGQDLFPPFAELLRKIPEDFRDIREYALEQSIQQMVSGYRAHIKARRERILAAEVSLAALDRFPRDADSSNIEIDFSELRKDLEKGLKKYQGTAGKFEWGYDGLVGLPIKLLEILGDIYELEHKSDHAEPTKPTKPVVKASWTAQAMRSFLRPFQVQSGPIPIEDGRLAKLMKRYAEEFDPSAFVKQADGKILIRMPSRDLLPPHVRAHLDQLLQPEEHPELELQKEINDALAQAVEKKVGDDTIYVERRPSRAKSARLKKAALTAGSTLVFAMYHPLAILTYAGLTTIHYREHKEELQKLKERALDILQRVKNRVAENFLKTRTEALRQALEKETRVSAGLDELEALLNQLEVRPAVSAR